MNDLQKFMASLKKTENKEESSAYKEEKEKSLKEEDKDKEKEENEASYSCVDFFSKLLHCANRLHFFCWQAKSMNSIQVIRDCYSKMRCILDLLVDLKQAECGEILIGYALTDHDIKEKSQDEYTVEEYLEDIKTYITDTHSLHFDKEDICSQTLISELFVTINKALFKLKVLKA